jgi:type VI secretion system protein VasJ
MPSVRPPGSSTVPPVSTYREEVTQRIATLVAPIAGANPAGADVSYDTDFETIKAEIDKLSSVDNLDPAWSKIESLGTQILAQKGKDFRVAGWMSVAKVKTQGWAGFAEALILLEVLARSFWDTMYPEARRARARVNAFAWMTDMVHQHLLPMGVTFADGDAIRAADEVLKDLDQLLAEKLGELYTGPGQLRSLLRDKVLAIPEPPRVEEAPVPGAVGDAPVAQAQAPAAPVGPTSVADVEPATRTSGGVLVEAAAILRAADPARAWGYKLQRWGTWVILEEAPPAQDGRTYVPSPGDTAQLAALRDGQQWLELLNTAEQMTSQYLFWLDLHRFVALALDNLGPAFAAAREVVGREVTYFVARMPILTSLSFDDGTPFADSATQTWLEDEARKWGAGGGGSAASAVASAEDEEIAKRFVEAQQMVTGGKVADGLASALALADRAADARMRFRARLAVGKMALDAAKHELARGMLEHLVVDVERHGLETWEPATCATLYSYLLVASREVSRAKGGSPDLVAREQYLFDKLCRLDPASAIKLST